MTTKQGRTPEHSPTNMFISRTHRGSQTPRPRCPNFLLQPAQVTPQALGLLRRTPPQSGENAADGRGVERCLGRMSGLVLEDFNLRLCAVRWPDRASCPVGGLSAAYCKELADRTSPTTDFRFEAAARGSAGASTSRPGRQNGAICRPPRCWLRFSLTWRHVIQRAGFRR